MSKSSSVYTRVDPELKVQAEQVFSVLGIPMANAINLFLHQVVLHQGIPFEVKIPQSFHLDYSMITNEQFDTEIEKGMSSLNAGKTIPGSKVREKIQRQYKQCSGR